MTPEASRVMNFLAGCPGGSSVLLHADTQSLLLSSGGNLLARGSLYNIKANAIGAGVYKITLELANP